MSTGDWSVGADVGVLNHEETNPSSSDTISSDPLLLAYVSAVLSDCSGKS